MLETIIATLLWVSAVGCGVMAGVYFAFSGFIMAALKRIAPESGIAAMQSINRVILGSTFMPLFFGTTLTSAALALYGGASLGAPGGVWMLAGGVLYGVGMFVVTAAFNVPLNNRLEAVAADTPEAREIWAVYLRDWLLWNHLRTVASALACGCFISAIAER